MLLTISQKFSYSSFNQDRIYLSLLILHYTKIYEAFHSEFYIQGYWLLVRHPSYPCWVSWIIIWSLKIIRHVFLLSRVKHKISNLLIILVYDISNKSM